MTVSIQLLTWKQYSVADLENNKGGGWFGMESTGQWSYGLGSLNPKYHYEYQEMRGVCVASRPIHPPGSATDIFFHAEGI